MGTEHIVKVGTMKMGTERESGDRALVPCIREFQDGRDEIWRESGDRALVPCIREFQDGRDEIWCFDASRERFEILGLNF